MVQWFQLQSIFFGVQVPHLKNPPYSFANGDGSSNVDNYNRYDMTKNLQLGCPLFDQCPKKEKGHVFFAM